MKKLSGLLLLTAVPLLLAGCGQKEHKSSMHMNSSQMKSMSKNSSSKNKSSSSSSSMKMSDNNAKSASAYSLKNPMDMPSMSTKQKSAYKHIDVTKKASSKVTKASDYNKKLAIPGTITKVGKFSHGYSNLLVTGTNGQKYLVTIKKNYASMSKVNDRVIVYGYGLTKATGSQKGTGFTSAELGSHAMDFSADGLTMAMK